MIKRKLFWIFLLLASSLIGQNDSSIVGTYVLTEKRGLHVEPGVSYGDTHPASYITSVDTTITRTLTMDSLKNVIVIIDTSYGNSAVRFNPIINMKGKWNLVKDTLTIEYDSVLYIYQGYVLIDSIMTIVADDTEVSILPDKKEYVLLKNSIIEHYRILSYDYIRYMGLEENKRIDTNIEAIILLNEERNWMKYGRK